MAETQGLELARNETESEVETRRGKAWILSLEK